MLSYNTTCMVHTLICMFIVYTYFDIQHINMDSRIVSVQIQIHVIVNMLYRL